MITTEILQLIIEENNGLINNAKTIIHREIKIASNIKLVIVIAGIRRSGKSTFLKTQFHNTKTLYVNFEDTRLASFAIKDFLKLEKIAVQNKISTFLFNEIQNIEGWKKYIRAAHDKNFKIFITGSNASLLSREFGTKLTGRYILIKMFPFSYSEFLQFFSKKPNTNSFLKYLELGGFPEYLSNHDSLYLQNLLRDVVMRDIAVRKKIRNENIILRLAMYLISNVSKPISYNKLTQQLSIKSVRSTIDYCDYLRDSYLFDFVPKFSYSLKNQMINPKKVYCIDTGMIRANSLSFSKDDERLLENAVLIFLKKFNYEIFYFTENNTECDFIIKQKDKVVMAVQVCWQLNEDNIERETKGLKAAMNSTGLKKGTIITLNQADNFENIEVVKVWEWMMGVKL